MGVYKKIDYVMGYYRYYRYNTFWTHPILPNPILPKMMSNCVPN